MAYYVGNDKVAIQSLGLAAAPSLTNVSAVSTGSVVDGATVRSTAVLAVTTGTGVSAGAVQLQGSLDGQNWFNVGSAVTTSAASTTTQLVADSAYAQYFRASITTAIVGGKVWACIGVSG